MNKGEFNGVVARVSMQKFATIRSEFLELVREDSEEEQLEVFEMLLEHVLKEAAQHALDDMRASQSPEFHLAMMLRDITESLDEARANYQKGKRFSS